MVRLPRITDDQFIVMFFCCVVVLMGLLSCKNFIGPLLVLVLQMLPDLLSYSNSLCSPVFSLVLV